MFTGRSERRLGLFLNLLFYPKLLSYQSGTNAAEYLNENFTGEKVASTLYSGLFEFYLDEELIRVKSMEQLKALDKNTLVFVAEDYLEKLDENQVSYSIVKEFGHFHITKITPKFLNPETRQSALQSRYIIRLN